MTDMLYLFFLAMSFIFIFTLLLSVHFTIVVEFIDYAFKFFLNFDAQHTFAYITDSCPACKPVIIYVPHLLNLFPQ